jgi:4-aminobutyrate aminotransferase
LFMPSLTRPYQLVVDHAEGSTVYDVDGNGYIDFAALQPLIITWE